MFWAELHKSKMFFAGAEVWKRWAYALWNIIKVVPLNNLWSAIFTEMVWKKLKEGESEILKKEDLYLYKMAKRDGKNTDSDTTFVPFWCHWNFNVLKNELYAKNFIKICVFKLRKVFTSEKCSGYFINRDKQFWLQ